MSNLEKLTAKIKADSEIKANKIMHDAKREAEAIIAKSEGEAKAEASRLIASAEDESKKLKETMLSAKQIEIRDKKLGAKQQTINDALAEAKKRLTAMSDSDYVGFIWKYLAEVNLTGDETLRIPKKYAEGFDMADLNGRLKASGKPALTLDGSIHVDNGFKLVKNDAENDFSFDALIDYYRVDLERTVVERVFQ